jgi:hypothetical protein
LPRTICGLPTRLFAYIGSSVAVALPLVAFALTRVALDPPSFPRAVAVVLFVGLTLAADLRPVPMDESRKSEVSVASVFIVTSAIVFGWLGGRRFAQLRNLLRELNKQT